VTSLFFSSAPFGLALRPSSFFCSGPVPFQPFLAGTPDKIPGSHLVARCLLQPLPLRPRGLSPPQFFPHPGAIGVKSVRPTRSGLFRDFFHGHVCSASGSFYPSLFQSVEFDSERLFFRILACFVRFLHPYSVPFWPAPVSFSVASRRNFL